ncbi:hypothetical protein NUITMVR1_28180 [Raoultella ornithinolytica]|nr:hypothetical protein NUITMVR1_28180 [Raoultella ornithinolytica]
MAVTGIVHQHINRTDGRFNLRYHLSNTPGVRNIQQAAESPLCIKGLESLLCVVITHGPDNPMTCGECFLRQRTTKAAADASD